MKKTKAAGLILAASMFVTMFAAPQAQAATTKEPIQVGDNVYATLDDIGTLTISGTGDMWANTHMAGDDQNGKYYIGIGQWMDGVETCPWFGEYQYDINAIVFGEGVTSVGDNATTVCESLEVTKVPEKVMVFHKYPIGLPALSKVTIGSDVQTIGRGAFLRTTALKSITIPQNVQEVGEYAFYESGLKSVKLEDGLEKIGEYAFYGTQLTGVNVPGSVRSIEANAFNNSVSNATINPGTKVIKTNAFGKVNAVIYSKDVVITEGAFLPGSVFTCYKGSTADEYAANHGITVKYISDKPSKAKKPGVSSKNKKLYITCKKMAGVDGYKIRYATNSKMKQADTVMGRTATIVGLKAGKKYYVQACAYKKNSSGKKVYGAWSDVVTVVIK